MSSSRPTFFVIFCVHHRTSSLSEAREEIKKQTTTGFLPFQQQRQQMYGQALSLMARVYIGSISFEVREENIKKAFEHFGPIKSINMSWDAATGVSVPSLIHFTPTIR